MDLARYPHRPGFERRAHSWWALRVQLCFAAVSLPTSAAAAQTLAPVLYELRPVPTVVERADALLAAVEAEKALDSLARYLIAVPDDVEARWRAAKAAALVGLLSPSLSGARPWYRKGIAHADTALQAVPDHPDALRWSMVARGRLALWTGARETADLAQDVWDLSHHFLADDDQDAIAHHALGVLHHEVMRLSRVERFLARLFLRGDALSNSSWEEALRHLKRAAELEPENKMFRLFYARALADHGRTSEGLAEAQSTLALPVTDPLDARHHYLLERFVNETQR